MCIQEMPQPENEEGIDALTECIVSVKAEVARLKQMVDEAQKVVKETDETRINKLLKKKLKTLGGCVSEDKEKEVRKSLEGQIGRTRTNVQIKADAALKCVLEQYTTESSHLSELEASHRGRVSYVISVATRADGFDGLHAFRQTIEAIVLRWSRSMDHLALSIGSDALSSNASKYHFDITEPHLLQLKHLHALESLHIEGWKLPLEPSFPLISIIGRWSNIKHVHLPFFSGVSPVKLDVLRDIADSCPRLESLQLKLDISTLPQIPGDSGAMFALRHGLRRLMVESSTGTADSRAQKQIARYLNVLFPYLKTVACLASEGPVAEIWNEVNELISLLRLVKEDDRARGAVETKET
ncbi:hypothetical protein BDQ17DRAFT_684966 [Cyathus striatus]|nr:hypothetical protein BDQ17DRAFT_684966 [Cyathus striatus]